MKNVFLYMMFMVCLALQAQTDIYQRYYVRDDLERVACLMNHRIDDGTCVGITLLRVHDSVELQALMAELKLPQVHERCSGSVILFLRDDSDPANPAPRRRDGKVNLRKSCLLGLSLSEYTIFIYHNIRTEHRYRSILTHVIGRNQTKNK